MKLEHPTAPYAYELPEDRIAQRPTEPYDMARLLVLRRAGQELSEATFLSLPELLTPSDLIVFNDTKVAPCRLFAKTERGVEVELLLLSQARGEIYRSLARPLKRLREGQALAVNERLSAHVVRKSGDGSVELRFEGGGVADIERAALMPIPPYIRDGRADARDRIDYQTHFARVPGSIAAPTASLHFTPRLIEAIRAQGCEISYLTLHVGLASIRPVLRPGQAPASVEPERCIYAASLLSACRAARSRGGRVVAVGTTVVRALESMARLDDGWDGREFDAGVFITPGHDFRLVDAMVTNFHQPGTTHLLLVEAFLQSRAALDRCYRYAMESGFRFLSYGDGMFIL